MDFYTYKAYCYNIVDGDTMDVSIDLGFKVKINERIRLAGINTPEIYGVKKGSEEYNKGVAAKEEVERLILNKNIIVKTEKDETGKYGRYIAFIYTDTDTESPTFEDSCLNDYLVKIGFATTAEY